MTRESFLSAFKKLGREFENFHFFAETDSTNTRLENFLKNGEDSSLVLSLKQSAGKGRFKRSWLDEEGKSVALSFGLSLKGKTYANLHLFTLLSAVKICFALRDYSGLDLQLKWPNDIYLNGKKLGGMLADLVSEGGKLKYLIFGIGVNFKALNHPDFLMFESLESSEKDLDLSETSAIIADAILHALEDLSAGQTLDLAYNFSKLDFLYNKRIKINFYDQIKEGIASGIDCSGALILKQDSGEIFLANAGESSIVKS